MFDIAKFARDYHITRVTTGKHYREGWFNINCPFCGGTDGHLGIHLTKGSIKCYRCGKHGELKLVKTLLGCDWDRAIDIHKLYETKGRSARIQEGGKTAHKDRPSICEYPSSTGWLDKRHRAYLEARKYDPDLLVEVWGLRGTDFLGPYKFRVIAPITYKDKMVSYQGRDITGVSDKKYKACAQINEVIDHQTLLYGLDQCRKKACIVVEGIADVWRLGPGAVCCFGIAFTMAQVNLLASNFKTIYIMFDGGETEAAKQAQKLAILLSSRGIDVELLFLDKGDPGEMDQSDADQLMRDLYLEGYQNFR